MPLIAFVVAGRHAALVDFLLRQGAAIGPYSAGLLGLAAAASRRDLVELLVAHGADVRAVDASIFVRATDLNLISYLLRHGASANRPGDSGFPPLVYVARGDKGECPEKVRLLLEQGAAVDAVGPKGRTALHYAAAAGYSRVIQVLLDHGATVSLRDAHGETALSLARAAGKTAAATLLIQRGADQ